MRFTKSGAGAGAGVGLREGGLAVLANAELKSSIMLLTMKIIENSISSLATGLSYLDISILSKFLYEKSSTVVRSYHNKTYQPVKKLNNAGIKNELPVQTQSPIKKKS